MNAESLIAGFKVKLATQTLTLIFVFSLAGCAVAQADGEMSPNGAGRMMVAAKTADLSNIGEVAALAFSPDGAKFAVEVLGSYKINVWTTQDLKRPLVSLTSPDGVGTVTNFSKLSFSRSGRFLALMHDTSLKGTRQGPCIEVWDLATGAYTATIQRHENQYLKPSFAFGKEDRELITLYGTLHTRPMEQVVVYQSQDWNRAWGKETFPLWPNRIATSPDGRLAAIAGVIYGDDIVTRAPIWLMDLASHKILQHIDAFSGDAHVAGLTFSPDGGRLVASATFDNPHPDGDNIKVFSVVSGDEIKGASSHEQAQSDLAFARNGKYLLQSTLYGSANVWNASITQILQTIPASLGIFAVSENGQWLIVATENGAAVWRFL